MIINKNKNYRKNEDKRSQYDADGIYQLIYCLKVELGLDSCGDEQDSPKERKGEVKD